MSLKTVLGLIVIILVFFTYWIKKKFAKLDELGFVHEKPSFPLGNLNGIGTKYHMVDILHRLYNKFNEKAPIHGIYLFFNSNFAITDLELIKDILIRDFDVFHNRGIFNSKEHDPLTTHLFALEDQEWKVMRHKLLPTYTSGKMKMMFNTMLDVSTHMIENLKSHPNLDDVDIKEVLARYMTDVVGNVAFGLEMNAISKPDSKFRQMGRKVFKTRNFMAQVLLFTNFRNLARLLGIRLFPKDVSDFFREIVKETVKYRRENNIERNDALNLLMKIGTEGREGEEKLTLDEIAAQCFLFFVAGYETSSSTSSFTLFNLVQNPEIQENLRNEIKTVLANYDNKVTYEALKEMKLLQMVIDETLRMYPPGAIGLRKASRDYKIRNSKLVIPKDSLVIIPIFSIHNDPKNYPEPEKFNPQRFNEENKAKRHPMAHIPFGNGPRNCIGDRFAMTQTKIALIQLLINFRFLKTNKTPDRIIFDAKHPVLSSAKPICLKVSEL
ncbi:hypothetical protein ACKWTF_013875 [Chironomus riparius]